MVALAISILWVLIGLCVLVGIGWVILWVFNQLGIIIPPMVIKLAMIILGLLCLIWLLGVLAGGGSGFPGMNGGGSLGRHSVLESHTGVMVASITQPGFAYCPISI
jgi:hypothetical protein